MIIDWQHHFRPGGIPVGMRKLQAGQPTSPPGSGHFGHFRPEAYELNNHLKFMDNAGIDIAVLSADGCITLEECKIADDAFASIMKQYPSRFVGLASCVPTIGPESLEELDRAIDVLGLKGIYIDAQIEGCNLDDDILLPFYEKVSRLDVPIFVHIRGTRYGYEAFEKAKYNLGVTLGTMVMDLSATARIILGGILAKFPELKFVISHMGGGISAIKERLVRYIDTWGNTFWTDLGGTPPFDEPLAESFNEHFNRLYFDMAGYEGGMNAVKCALTTISPERLIFGTDYPLNFTNNPKAARNYIENIKKLSLPQASIEAILDGNAAKLLNIK